MKVAMSETEMIAASSEEIDVPMKKKVVKKRAKAGAGNKTGNPTYAKMVTEAILGLKERKGSSRQAILKYMSAKYKVDAAVAQPRLNKTLKKMVEDGNLVAGAKTGTSGAGCFKLSPEAKNIFKKEAAARKKGKGDAATKKATGKKVAKKSTKGKGVPKSVKGKKTGTKSSQVNKAGKKKPSVGKKLKPKKSGAKPKKGAKQATKAKK